MKNYMMFGVKDMSLKEAIAVGNEALDSVEQLQKDVEQLQKDKAVLTGKKRFSEAFTTSDDKEEPAAKKIKLDPDISLTDLAVIATWIYSRENVESLKFLISLAINNPKATIFVSQVEAMQGVLQIEPTNPEIRELKTAILEILKEDASLNERYTNYKPDLGSTSSISNPNL